VEVCARVMKWGSHTSGAGSQAKITGFPDGRIGCLFSCYFVIMNRVQPQRVCDRKD
jgi:hypothetical protein